MRFVTEPWNGKEQLWKVFWLYNFLIGNALLFGIGLLPQGTLHAAVFLFMLVYFIWIAVSLWRCAYNVDTKLWGHLTRILVVILVIGILKPFFLGFTGA